MTQEEPPIRPKRSTLTNVGNVLNTIVTKLGLDRRLREKALMNLWPIVAGDTFALNTRPLFVDYENNLVVAVRDAATAQELSFLKRQITNKLKLAGKSAGIKIEGLRFDLKHFHQASQIGKPGDGLTISGESISNESLLADVSANAPDEKTLNELALSEDETKEIDWLKSEIIGNAELIFDQTDQETIAALAKRIANTVEKELRLRKWQKLNGFPICTSCKLPSARLHTQLSLCSYCYLRQNADKP